MNFGTFLLNKNCKLAILDVSRPHTEVGGMAPDQTTPQCPKTNVEMGPRVVKYLDGHSQTIIMNRNWMECSSSFTHPPPINGVGI